MGGQLVDGRRQREEDEGGEKNLSGSHQSGDGKRKRVMCLDKERVLWSFYIADSCWRGDLACHISKNSKYVRATS